MFKKSTTTFGHNFQETKLIPSISPHTYPEHFQCKFSTASVLCISINFSSMSPNAVICLFFEFTQASSVTNILAVRISIMFFFRNSTKRFVNDKKVVSLIRNFFLHKSLNNWFISVSLNPLFLTVCTSRDVIMKPGDDDIVADLCFILAKKIGFSLVWHSSFCEGFIPRNFLGSLLIFLFSHDVLLMTRG